MILKFRTKLVVLSLIMFASLGTIWNLPTNSNVFCENTNCGTSAFDSENVLKASLVQDVEIKIAVQPKRVVGTQTNYADPEKGIGLSRRMDNGFLITIPMRNGKIPTFDYLVPPGVQFKELSVRINDSQSILIFLDGRIAYSHRYENAPFFVNGMSLVTTPKQAGKVEFQTTELQQTIKKKSSTVTRIFSILFVSIFFALGTLTSLRKFLPLSHSKIPRDVVPGNSFKSLVGISWVLSIFIWVRNPIDATGAVNPGPFGPIGAAFSDFYQLSQLAHFERPYDLGGTNYPPAGLLFLRLLTIFDPNNLSLFVIVGIFLGTLIHLFIRKDSNWKSIALFILPFPFVFGVVRGNLDLFAIFLCWMSVLAFKRKSLYVSSTLLAIAISIKVWPIVFLLFFFSRKTVKPLIWSILLSLQLTLGASFFFGYHSIFQAIKLLFSSVFQQSTLGTYSFQNTFSFTALMFIVHLLLMARNPIEISEFDINRSIVFINSAYAQLLVISLLFLFIFLFAKAQKFSTKFLILCGVATMIPTQSFTYRGLVILLFFYLTRDEATENRSTKKRLATKKKVRVNSISSIENSIMTWSAIPLFAPTAFYFVPGTQFSTASFLQPLGLATFMILKVFADMRSSSQTHHPYLGKK